MKDLGISATEDLILLAGTARPVRDLRDSHGNTSTAQWPVADLLEYERYADLLVAIRFHS